MKKPYCDVCSCPIELPHGFVSVQTGQVLMAQKVPCAEGAAVTVYISLDTLIHGRQVDICARCVLDAMQKLDKRPSIEREH